jgi:hypothetical protein
MMRMMFALMDADGDGTISPQEFQAAHERIFRAMQSYAGGDASVHPRAQVIGLARRSGTSKNSRPDEQPELAQDKRYSPAREELWLKRARLPCRLLALGGHCRARP